MTDTALIVRHLLEDDEDEFLKDITQPLTPSEIASLENDRKALRIKQLRDKILAQGFRESQYVEGYLLNNKQAGYGKGLTPGSYIAYKVSRRARDWASRYKNALVVALERRVQAGLAVRGPSRLGGSAYYPKSSSAVPAGAA